MDTMDRTGRVHIQPGMEVFDVDAQKVGSVVHLYESDVPGSDRDVIEVKTGFLGLGKHLFIPRSAIKDVTEGGVFLSAAKGQAGELGWETRPADLDTRASSHGEAAAETPQAPPASTWEEALPQYRARCYARYGTDANWERYEPRYRFAWDMSQAPDLAGQTWEKVAPELRQRWEVMHPEVDWEGASDAIRDAWVNPPVASGSGTEATPHAA